MFQTGTRRGLARAGARAAIVQALTVAGALTLAGMLTGILTERLQVNALRERVLGETRSLEDELRQHGSSHLPQTIAKRSRLWRGFAYRLEAPDQGWRAGFLPAARFGWTQLSGQPRDRARPRRPFLIFSERMSDGAYLSVGQDFSAQALASAVLLKSLLFSGAVGILLGTGVSYALSRRAWRGVAAIAETARQVERGALDPRTPVRPGAPRDDLDELALTFNAMLDRIGGLVGQIRQVSRDIAHDLRTPLTRIRHRLERLRHDAQSDPELASRVEQVEKDIAEVLRIFDALLQMAEIEGERPNELDQAFDLGEVAVRVAEAFRPDVEDGGRRLEVLTYPAPVRGHEQLVAQAIANLLENAVRHTQSRADIRVEVKSNGGRGHELVVEDNGPGIPEAQRELALRPLVRLDASRHLPGSGLGLSIVAAVAARHRASLRLDDAGPGLRVLMTFPAASTPSAAEPQKSRGTPAAPGPNRTPRPCAEGCGDIVLDGFGGSGTTPIAAEVTQHPTH